MELTPQTFIDLLSKAPAAGLLAVFIVAVIRKWIVPSWYVEMLEKDRDEWKKIALDSMQVARGAVDAARKDGG